MIQLMLSEEEAVEVANHTAYTALHAIDDDDDGAWRVGYIAVAILAKLEAAFPEIDGHPEYSCGNEVSSLRRRVADHAASRK